MSYGTLTLIDASPVVSLIEPLTVEEVRRYLRLPVLSPVDDEDDDYIETLIIAARELAEAHQNKDLVEKHYRLSLDCWPCHAIELRYPLSSVSRIRYRDSDGTWTTLTEDTDYIVDTSKRPGLVCPVYGESWPSFTPWPSSAIEIEFASGYAIDHIFWGDAGQRVLTGMKLWISWQYTGRVPSGLDEEKFMERVVTLLSIGQVSRA